MLERLEVENLALLERACLEPDAHFTVMSGETGAGKSLLLGAMEAITGSRMSKDQVRTGADRARVEALFSPPQVEGEECILSRELSREGKSYCRINGRMSPLAQLREEGERRVSIHGQRESQKIFEPKEHSRLLLRYCLLERPVSYDRYLAALHRWKEAMAKLKEVGMDEEERLRRIDLLRFQLEELRELDLHEGDEERLRHKRQRFQSLAHLGTTLQQLTLCLDGSGERIGALAELEEANRYLQELQTMTEKAKEVGQALEEALRLSHEVALRIQRLHQHLEFQPEEMEAVESKLDLLSRMKRKYGGSEAAVLRYREKASKQLDLLERIETVLERREAERIAAEEDLLTTGESFHQEVLLASQRLCQAIQEQLRDLAMPQAEFSLHFEKKSLREANEEGLYRAEFLLRSNLGEEARPLAKIASGGEASRILLAIKVVLAAVDGVEVLVFDEIDSGISGETAARVGEKLLRLSRFAQVICVTHSAYIASMADRHYEIKKSTGQGRTKTTLHLLDAEGARREVARLLSGDTDRALAEQLAASLQQKAHEFKLLLQNHPAASVAVSTPSVGEHRS